MATIHDVARAAGVSRSTASRALAGYGVVSKEAAERVLAAAAELGYHANGVARSMKTGRSNTLGAVVADIENAFFARAMRGFTDVARANGFQVILTQHRRGPGGGASAVRVFQERRVDGIVVTPASLDRAVICRAAHAAGVPIVLLDRRVPRSGRWTSCRSTTSERRGRRPEQLIAAGHRKIAMVTGVTEIEVPVQRRTSRGRVDQPRIGWRAIVRRWRRPALSTDPTTCARLTSTSWRPGSEAERLLRMRDRPTAVFATDSTNALGVLLALRDVGLRSAAGRLLVAFDDADWADVVEPGLSVMAQPVYEMGRLAASLLVSRIRGEALRPKQHVLDTQWLARESVGPPPRRRRRLYLA